MPSCLCGDLLARHAARFQRLLVGFALALALLLAGALPAAAAGPHWYMPRAGETLGSVARLLGVGLESLITLNGLPRDGRVYPGGRLLIPERHVEVAHIAQPGETLGSIARLYDLDPDALARQSGVMNPDRIEVGQALTVTLDAGSMWVGDLPADPIESAVIAPWPVRQGQTAALLVTTSRPISLTATFAGRDVPLAGEGGRQWALLGVHPLAQPGFYPITLRPAAPADAGLPANWSVALRLYVAAGAFDTYDIYLPPSEGKDKLLDPQLIQAEQAKLNLIFAGHSPARLWDSLFRPPLPAEGLLISSMFGERRSYNGGPVSSYHEGTDYAAAEGTLVTAPAAGVVVLAEQLTVRGNGIILDHGFGVYTGYWHLSEIEVKAGQTVRAGEVIGKVGTTGLSTGAHLHWEMRVAGVPVDAAQWVSWLFP